MRLIVLICGLFLGIYGLPFYAHSAENTLKWGSDATSNVPYSYHDLLHPQHMAGFEYDIVNALAARLQRRPVFVQNDWDGLIPGLSRDLYEFVICGIEITPQRAQEVDFSEPYYIAQERIVTLRSRKDITGQVQLHHKHVGTIKNTHAQSLLEADPTIAVSTYDEESLAFSDLLHGRTDAILIDNPIAIYYSFTDPAFEIVGPPIGTISYGIAFARGQHRQLRLTINHLLTAMKQDGSLRKILDHWQLWNQPTSDALGDQTVSTTPPSAYLHYQEEEKYLQKSAFNIMHYVRCIPIIAKAALITLVISLLSMIVAMILGLVMAIIRLYGPALLSKLTAIFIEIIRGTPLLIQILFIFYGLPQFGINFSPLLAAIISLGLNYSAYEAENYRVGLQATPRGQLQAALALNMTRGQALRYVLLPQAFRTVLPVIINDFISLLKDSSLVSMITLTELTQTYIRLSSSYFDYIGTGIMIGLAYLLLGLPFIRLGHYMEKKLAQTPQQTR